MSETPPEVAHLVQHVLSERERHLQSHNSSASRPPLFVGVQGPQGSGKTFLSSYLKAGLTASPHALSAVVISIDDLYLPHDGLVRVAKEHAHNSLLQGRGQPGTHDLPLGFSILHSLQAINDPSAESEVKIPFFDKSLYSGEGDRTPESDWTVVRSPVDVVILEGWFVGFGPCSTSELEERYTTGAPLPADVFSLQSFCSQQNIIEINERLAEYTRIWEFIDAFIQLSPADGISNVYTWRTDQEHWMKAHNGGRGMTDEQVKRFVDRYIPGYVFFADGVTRGLIQAEGVDRELPPWTGRGLRLVLGSQREVIRTEKF